MRICAVSLAVLYVLISSVLVSAQPHLDVIEALYGNWTKEYGKNLVTMTIQKNEMTLRATCRFDNGMSKSVEVSGPIEYIKENHILINVTSYSRSDENDGMKCEVSIKSGKYIYKIEGNNLIFIDSRDKDITHTFKRAPEGHPTPETPHAPPNTLTQNEKRRLIDSLRKQEMRQAQERLQALRFSAGMIDGVMGPQTRDALRQFQKSQGLLETGELDEKTRDALLGDLRH